jgi:hypothetical protein
VRKARVKEVAGFQFSLFRKKRRRGGARVAGDEVAGFQFSVFRKKRRRGGGG